MSKVVRMDGSPMPTGKVIEESRHYFFFNDNQGSSGFTQEGARVWGPLLRKANINILSITDVSALTAGIQRACEVLDDEMIEMLTQRHSADELEPLAQFFFDHQPEIARALLGAEEPGPTLTPID